MKRQKRVVRRIEPNRRQSFDQQFWPVLVAICVLCGIAVGAAMTLLKGQWMWFSLLLLPSAAAFSIYLLYRLDDSKLRRSLQLAVLLSLAAHLAILIIASMTHVFQNDYQQQRPQVAKRQPKTITIRNKTTNFVWEQPNLRETPEPKVEQQRTESTTPQKTPQPVPVEESKPTTQPSLTKRKQSRQSVPRLDKELSKRRRQTKQNSPKMSSQVAAKSAARSSSSSSASSKATAEPASSASAASRSRSKTEAKSTLTAAKSQPQSQSEPAPSQPKAAQRPTETQRAEVSKPNPNSSSVARRSTARIRRRSPLLSKSEPAKSLSQTTEKPKQTQRPTPTPARRANQITRRETRQTLNPASTNQPRTVASPKAAVANTKRRETQQPPTLTRSNSSTRSPRRSTEVAVRPTTTQAIEAPSRAPRSQSESRDVSPRALALTRGTQGTAGAVRDRNMSNNVGGQISPATRPSDSAQRRRTVSTTSPQQLMTPVQASAVRQSVARAPKPSSTLTATTQMPSTVTGSSSPTNRTLQASAAASQIAAAAPQSEISAQQGAASVDVGPTKIVADSESQTRSGGGQPEMGATEDRQVARSSRTSNETTPTLSADISSQTASQPSPDATPAGELETSPSEQSLVNARQGADQAFSFDRSASETTGPKSDAGAVSNLTGELADSRQRASESSPMAAGESEDENDEQRKQGSRRTQLAQSLKLSKQVASGSGEVENGPATGSTANGTSQGLAESVAANMMERAASGMTGTLVRGAANGLVQSATALPVADFAGSGRARSQSRTNPLGAGAGDAANGKTRARAGAGQLSNPKLTQSGLATSANPLAMKAAGQGQGNLAGPDTAKADTNRAISGGGARLEIAALEGPAGLAEKPAASIGVRTRPASRDSNQLTPDTQQRFRSNLAGGTPSFNPNVITAKDAFRSRQPGAMQNSAPSTEASIQLGLEFLARNQKEDGRWTLEGFDGGHPIHDDYQLKSDSAATGLALLAFQGAGYTHKEFKYAEVVDKALKSLIENQQNDGCLYEKSKTKSDKYCQMYSHAIATLALCEAYGMTRDPELVKPTEKALAWIAMTQDPENGGWRYYAALKARRTDTSVTGWMLMALQSGRLAELKTDRQAFEGIKMWLERAVDTQPHRYRYNPFSSDSEQDDRSNGRIATPSMTAVGLLMKIYNGLDKDDPILEAGAQYMIDQQLPSEVNSFLRDTYYWYYATQVFKHLDGDLWEFWNDQLHPMLVKTQLKTGEMAGSWHPYEPVPDRWAQHAGRLYLTTMNLLSLEVRYRLLPLYEETLN